MHASMYVCMYICIMYVCMDACIDMYGCMMRECVIVIDNILLVRDQNYSKNVQVIINTNSTS